MSPRCFTLIAEPMEDRILHSADLAPLVLAGAGAEMLAQQPVQSASTSVEVRRSEIVFVDAALPDAPSLLADLQAQRTAGRPIEVVTIAVGEDGLARIGATLAARHDITAVHLIAHGSDGVLQLGDSTLDRQTLLRRAGEVAHWGAALTVGADLLLYGCDFAQTALGRGLVQDLSALTGADVAASTDLTGAAALGGNWRLEYQTGSIEAALAPSLREQALWQGILATYTVNTTVDQVLGLLPGSLRWAISQANANPGPDTINFAVNGSFNMSALSVGDDLNAWGDFDVTDSVNIVGNGAANTIINGNGTDRVFDLHSGSIAMSGLTIQGGRSSVGAGIHVAAPANVTLTDVVVQNNVGNSSSKGAGILDGGVLTLRNVVVQNNGNTLSGDAEGAGIYVEGGALLDARNVEVRGNIANSKNGGGLYITSNGAAALENVTFFGNQANNGGGIWNVGAALSLVNSTLSGNSALSEGGGLWTQGFVTLDHVTVANNTASIGGGVFNKNGNGNGNRNVNAVSSLFAGNSGGNINGAPISQGYNLSDDTSAGFSGAGDLSNVAAGLSPLASNGGFTRTHAIGAASAARDAANPVTALTMDQRGITYYGGRADIGSYEYNPSGFAPTVSAVANQAIDEDTTLAPVTFMVSDANTAAASLVVTATSSNTALVPNASIIIGGSGSSRSVSLTPAANANSSANGGPATITLSVSNGANTTRTSFTVIVMAVNDAPTVWLPAAQTVDQGTVLTLSGANAPAVNDVDAGSAALQLTLAVANGTLTLGQTSGLSFITGTGSVNASMSFQGSQTAINAALAGLRYRPNTNYNGSDALTLNVNDLGNSGRGGPLAASGSLAISVNAVNDAPTLGLPGPQSTPQPTPLTFSSANGNAITVSDLDAGAAAVQLTLSTANAFGNGTLSFGSLTGLTLVSGTGTNDTTVVLRGSLADLNAALGTLRFSATFSGSAQIDLSINDLGNSGSGGAKLASGAVAITVGTDAPPVLTLARSTGGYTEGSAATPLDPALTLSDADNLTLASARVRIGSGYAGTEDVLAYTNDLSTMGNITGNISAGVLNLSSAGQTATVAQWQAALRSVTYANTSTAPNTAARVLTLTVNDGIADSAAKWITLTIVAVNNAPVLSGANALAAITEDLPAAGNGGTLVATLIAGHITDGDNPAWVGIAVTAVDNTNGNWQYSTDGGATWVAFGAVADNAARLLAADAATSVRFVPALNWNGSVTGGLTLRAWDQTSGSAGGVADTGLNGGTSAFSSATASTGITVTPVNDAPVLAGINAMTTITEDATGNAGTLVFALITGHVSDVDAAPLTGIAVTAVDNTNGNWQYSTDGGSTWLAFGAVADNAARLLAADAATSVRFVPALNWNGSVTGGLTLRAWDQTSGSAGGVADTGLNGGSSAFSTATASTSITVTPVNHAPVLAAAITAQGAVIGAPLLFQLPVATFIDPDIGDTLHYSATLADGSPLPRWLGFDASTRSFTGKPSDGDLGHFIVRVTATDDAGLAAQGLFAITISVPLTGPQPVPDATPNLPASQAPQAPATAQPAVTASSSAALAPAALVALPPPDPAPGEQPLNFTVQPASLSDAGRRDVADVGTTTHLASRADAVLTDAVLAQLDGISASPMNQLLRNDELAHRFEEMQRQLQQQGESRGATIASSILITSGLSIGYVVWLVRGGVLMGSMLSALPAWQMIDPLPVLAAARSGKGARKTAAADDTEVERFFDNRSPRAAPAPASKPADPDGASVRKAPRAPP